MEIKEGYKKTEAGIIPNDWEIKKLKEIAEFLDGKRKPIKDSERSKMKGIYPYYGASGIIDYVNDFLFDEELILLGEDGENILSRNVPLAFKVSGKIWVNNHAHVLRPKQGFDIDYITEKLESLNYEQFNTGTAQPKLNQKVCSEIPIGIPSSEIEQKAISTTLNYTDALINRMTKLLDKKRDIKQSAMQKLLQPKEGWEVRKISEIAEITKGEQLNRETLSENDTYPVFNGGISHSGFTDKWNTEGETIIISEGGNSCGYVNFINTRFWRGGHCYKVQTKIDKRFLFQLLKYREKEIMNLRVGSGLPNIQRSRLLNFELVIPKYEDQNWISKILADIDADISVLENTLKKYKLIKQGMIQNLLTGKIRLV